MLLQLSKKIIMALSITICFMSQAMELELDQLFHNFSLNEALSTTITFVGKDGKVTFDRNIACLSAGTAKTIQKYEMDESWNGEIVLPTIAASELEKIKQILELFYNKALSVYYAEDAIVDNNKILRALKKDIQSKEDCVVIRWLERLKPLVTMQNNQKRNELLQALNSFGLPLVEAIVQALREEAVHDIPYALKAFNDQRKEILSLAQHNSLLVDLNNTILQSRSVTSLISRTSLNGHTGWVLSATWSPDRKYIVTASHDKTAKIWSIHNGSWACIATLAGHTKWIRAAWSSDGKHIITASGDNTAKIWGNQNGTWICIATLIGHTEWVQLARWSPDGKHIVTASGDNTAKIWGNQNGTWICIATLTGHTSWVNSAAWSPDGKHIVTASRDGIAKIWGIHNGSWTCIATLEHTSWVNSATWSPDGKHVLTASYDNTAKIWGIQDGTWICIATLIGHTDSVYSAEWAPDGKHIVAASGDNTAKIWSIHNGSWACIAILTGNTYGVRSAVWSPDGTYIVTASADETAEIWNIGSFIKLENYLRYQLTYTEHIFLINVATAKNNGTQYQLNSTTQKVFDCLGGNDKQIKNALQNAIKPYVIKHKPTFTLCSVM